MTRQLVHQKQIGRMDCVATCVAMILGRPAAEVSREFNTHYHGNIITVPAYLSSQDFGINCIPHNSAGLHTLVSGNLYLITAPSCVTLGMFHQLVVDCRAGDIVVLDPTFGWADKSYYVAQTDSKLQHDSEDYDPLAFPLLSWIIDYTVILPEV